MSLLRLGLELHALENYGADLLPDLRQCLLCLPLSGDVLGARLNGAILKLLDYAL